MAVEVGHDVAGAPHVAVVGIPGVVDLLVTVHQSDELQPGGLGRCGRPQRDDTGNASQPCRR